MTYFWGRNLYTFSCVNGEDELPVFLRFGQGSRHDSVVFAFSVVEAWSLFSKAGLNVSVFIGDSAHDANPLYALLDDYGSKPVIALNKKPSSLIPLNEQGIPLCPKGFLMQYWGFGEKKSRFKWRCPKIVGKKRNRNKIDCTTPCTNSSYGFTCYTNPEWDRRIFTDIPRGSAVWKQLYSASGCLDCTGTGAFKARQKGTAAARSVSWHGRCLCVGAAALDFGHL
ncbi:MAG: hypothetical protein AB1796_02710 [Bacillota bacterium]